jgi:spore germination cell wall hydrolase CwlJ-like protein
MDAKSLLLRMHIRRIARRLLTAAALAGIVFAWATGRIDPTSGMARTFAFVAEKAGGKKHAPAEPEVGAAPAPAAGAVAGRLDNQTLCLAHAVYFEAGSDPRDVQIAIAQVVLNRTVTPKGKTDMRAICSVVYRGLGRPLGCLYRNTCQNIGNLPDDKARWAKAIEVANDVASGRAELPPLVQNASHFHPVGPRPVWTSSVYRLTRLGRMVFYSSSPVDVTAAAAQVSGASAGKLAATAAGPARDVAGVGAGAPKPLLPQKAVAAPAQKPREKAAKAAARLSPFGEAFQ